MIARKSLRFILFRNIGWKLLSLALAILVWITISREPNLAAVLAAPVQYKNFPPHLEISSETVETVDLETRGPAGLLRNLSEKRVAVVLDFTSVREPGERTFNVDRGNINLPRGVDLIRIIPSQLHFNFERSVVRRVPVQPATSGSLPSGMHVAKMLCNPATLAVAGPESKVESVKFLRTDPVDLNLVSDGRNVRVTAYVPNSQLRFKGPSEVTVEVSIAK